MSDITTIRELLQQRLHGQLTEAGREQLSALLNDPALQEEFQTVLQELMAHQPVLLESRPGWEQRIDEILQVDREVADPTAVPISRGRARKMKWAAAAAILLVLAGGAWFWQHYTRQPKAPIAAIEPHDLPPGGNRATLTVNGGMNIILDSSTDGSLIQQGGSDAVKQSGGRLVYQPSPLTKDQPPSYHTLSTPRGGQYQLTLPDGSRVWLDASSSITYPTAFRGPERRVTITGQAYLEIVHDPRRPFHVEVAGIEINDLGTAFNINAYPDEPAARITLVEGGVRISNNAHQLSLIPGQQAKVTADGSVTLVQHADVEQALAWKNGMVKLDGADIHEIMRQLSRWYDVDVEYQGDLQQAVFAGIVSRRQNISGLIRILEATGSVHFAVTDKKITVKP